jgi:hypothetical protein|tara:strand:- start:282 stop:875 length:594 start_codon:yes stop_codon:yes gene_type:complete
MEENTNFKKVFLITMIISLSISALIGIIIFLLGNFGEIEARILFTTLTIGGFSLTALCSSTLYEKHRYVPFSATGMIVAVVGFFITTLAIWEILDFEDIWKVIIISIILSVSIAHSSLLLLIKSRKTIVNVLLMLTLLFISIVALMLIIFVLGFDMDFEFYYRLLGVFAILDVLGTIVTPIALKVTSMNEPSQIQNQ